MSNTSYLLSAVTTAIVEGIVLFAVSWLGCKLLDFVFGLKTCAAAPPPDGAPEEPLPEQSHMTSMPDVPSSNGPSEEPPPDPKHIISGALPQNAPPEEPRSTTMNSTRDCLRNTPAKTSTLAKMGKLADHQKIFLGLAAVSVVMLVIALCDNSQAGFYIFLRIVTSAALVGLLIEKLSIWLKFILLLLLILYNPIIQVHLDNRSDWEFFNLITIPLLIVPWIILLRRNPEQEDRQDGSASTR